MKGAEQRHSIRSEKGMFRPLTGKEVQGAIRRLNRLPPINKVIERMREGQGAIERAMRFRFDI